MKTTKPYVSPWNRMDPKRTKETIANKDTEEGKPIFDIKEGENMPLYMFIGNLAFVTPIGNYGVNLLLVINHNQKTDKLKVSGRVRFDESGNKSTLTGKTEYDLKDLNKAKTEIKEIYQKAKTDLGTIETEPIHELEFKINEDLDSIINKLNQSNQFNIGVPED